MSIEYDYFRNPPREGDDEKPMLHPRVVVRGTIKTLDIANSISQRSSFSSADLKGILDNLAEQLYQGLSNSHNVYLEGIGTFSLTLESRFVQDIKEIRSGSIQVKSIKFRGDKQLKNRLKFATIERTKDRVRRPVLTDDDRFFRIGWYIDRYGSVNVSTVMRLNRCTHKKALADLAWMMEEGVIKRVQFGRLYAYMAP